MRSPPQGNQRGRKRRATATLNGHHAETKSHTPSRPTCDRLRPANSEVEILPTAPAPEDIRPESRGDDRPRRSKSNVRNPSDHAREMQTFFARILRIPIHHGCGFTYPQVWAPYEPEPTPKQILREYRTRRFATATRSGLRPRSEGRNRPFYELLWGMGTCKEAS